MIRHIGLSLAVALGISTEMASQTLAERSSISVSVGGETGLGDEFKGSGPFTGANYEFRVGRFFSIDAGQDTWLPAGRTAVPFSFLPGPTGGTISPILLSTTVTGVTVPVSTRFVTTAFHGTVRGILPLAKGRVELFAGIGPGYAWNLEGSPLPSGPIVDAEAGAQLALDKGQRFWLGAGIQYFLNFRHDEQEWLASSASFTFRFGRKR